MKEGPVIDFFGVVTTTDPVPALMGTLTISAVDVALITWALTPLNFTILSFNVELKPVPIIVTSESGLPEEGLIEVIEREVEGGGSLGCGSSFLQDPSINIKATNKNKFLIAAIG